MVIVSKKDAPAPCPVCGSFNVEATTMGGVKPNGADVFDDTNRASCQQCHHRGCVGDWQRLFEANQLFNQIETAIDKLLGVEPAEGDTTLSVRRLVAAYAALVKERRELAGGIEDLKQLLVTIEDALKANPKLVNKVTTVRELLVWLKGKT